MAQNQTFLSKLGNVLARGLAVASGLMPLISGLFGSNAKVQQVAQTVGDDLVAIAGVVVQTEAIIQTPGSGASKLAAATPLVANIIRTSEIVAGKKILNINLFAQGCQKVTSGIADILNALHPDAAQTANPTA